MGITKCNSQDLFKRFGKQLMWKNECGAISFFAHSRTFEYKKLQYKTLGSSTIHILIGLTGKYRTKWKRFTSPIVILPILEKTLDSRPYISINYFGHYIKGLLDGICVIGEKIWDWKFITLWVSQEMFSHFSEGIVDLPITILKHQLDDMLRVGVVESSKSI